MGYVAIPWILCVYHLMYVYFHEAQTKCTLKGIGAPISMKFNSGSICLVGSQPSGFPFHSTHLLQSRPHTMQVFHRDCKMP